MKRMDAGVAARPLHHTPACDPLEVRVAATPADYAASFRLAYQAYHPLGFIASAPSGLRISPQQLHPTALVLLALRKEEPVATLSLYADGRAGLPADAGWRSELDALRNSGRRLFECGTLAVRPDSHSGSADVRTCLKLIRFAWLFARAEPRACFCAFVQKRHAFFYERLLGYRRIGTPRRCQWGGLNIPEVLPLILDLSQAEQDYRARFEKFGSSSKNLFHFFSEEGPREAGPLLEEGLRRRQNLDFDLLRKSFAHFCPNAEAAPSGPCCPA